MPTPLRALRPTLLVAAALFVVVAAHPARALDEGVEEVLDFGANPGALQMFEHVPSSSTASSSPRPLVLVLHGCGQNESFGHDSGLLAAADGGGAIVVVAKQSIANHPQACFTWFDEGDITRERGELASLRAMVASAQARHDVDPARIYVIGLSAGGAMAAAALAAYPDVFAAGVVVAGAPVRCGVGVLPALSCMRGEVHHTPEDWAALARASLGTTSWDGPWPRIAIWSGDADTVVAPAVADELVAQWTALHALAVAPERDAEDRGVRVRAWGPADAVVVEHVSIAGMEHGFAVDPSSSCGQTAPYLPDVDVCTARAALSFFGLPVPDAQPAGEGEGEGDSNDVGVDAGDGDGDAPADDASSSCTAGGAGHAWAVLLSIVVARRRRR